MATTTVSCVSNKFPNYTFPKQAPILGATCDSCLHAPYDQDAYAQWPGPFFTRPNLDILEPAGECVESMTHKHTGYCKPDFRCNETISHVYRIVHEQLPTPDGAYDSCDHSELVKAICAKLYPFRNSACMRVVLIKRDKSSTKPFKLLPWRFTLNRFDSFFHEVRRTFEIPMSDFEFVEISGSYVLDSNMDANIYVHHKRHKIKLSEFMPTTQFLGRQIAANKTKSANHCDFVTAQELFGTILYNELPSEAVDFLRKSKISIGFRPNEDTYPPARLVSCEKLCSIIAITGHIRDEVHDHAQIDYQYIGSLIRQRVVPVELWEIPFHVLRRIRHFFKWVTVNGTHVRNECEPPDIFKDRLKKSKLYPWRACARMHIVGARHKMRYRYKQHQMFAPEDDPNIVPPIGYKINSTPGPGFLSLVDYYKNL